MSGLAGRCLFQYPTPLFNRLLRSTPYTWNLYARIMDTGYTLILLVRETLCAFAINFPANTRSSPLWSEYLWRNSIYIHIKESFDVESDASVLGHQLN